jgi:hypothetical protein
MILKLVLVLFSFATILGSAPQVHATTPLLSDGIGVNTICVAGNCNAQLLTTNRGHDIIILVAECGFTTCPVTISKILDSAGLVFLQRLSFQPNDAIWEYYAIANQPLTADNITVVFSGSFALTGMQVLAVHGADARGVFDSNLSIPATVSCPGPDCGACSVSSQAVCSAQIETSTTDLIVGIAAINDAPACVAGVPGFTVINTSGGRMQVGYAITTTPEETVAFACEGTDVMAITLDAISS